MQRGQVQQGEDIPVHGAKEVVIVVVVRGHNLRWGTLDGDGCLADVREVVSCDYLHIGHTSVRDQTCPRVKAWKMTIVSVVKDDISQKDIAGQMKKCINANHATPSGHKVVAK